MRCAKNVKKLMYDEEKSKSKKINIFQKKKTEDFGMDRVGRKMAKRFFKKEKKRLDKGGKVCYNNQCEPTERNAKSLGIACRCGGTGRRPGLKIP